MKFRYVLLIIGGLLLSFALVGVGILVRSRPNSYAFLDGQRPKRVSIEPDPIGMVGRESRYYLLPEQSSLVSKQAGAELEKKGWKEVSNNPSVFGRGPHERIEVTSATTSHDPQLVEGIPKADLSNYTIVKVIDPRMPPAIRQRLFHWTHHPLRGLIAHFA